MRNKQRISHPERPNGPGKIASGMLCGQWLYVSGQGPLDIRTLEYIPGTIEEETARTLSHIESIVIAAGGTRGDIVKCTSYLRDLADFPGYHAEFSRFFDGELPARTTVQADLLRGIRVEIDAVAFLSHLPA